MPEYDDVHAVADAIQDARLSVPEAGMHTINEVVVDMEASGATVAALIFTHTSLVLAPSRNSHDGNGCSEIETSRDIVNDMRDTSVLAGSVPSSVT